MLIETARNIIETYQFKGAEYAPMVENARRILREEMNAQGVNVEDLQFSKTNEQGNTVEVSYAARTKAQKLVCKAYGVTWKSITDRYDAQTRVVVLSRWAGL